MLEFWLWENLKALLEGENGKKFVSFLRAWSIFED